jgi:hypothetical protein
MISTGIVIGLGKNILWTPTMYLVEALSIQEGNVYLSPYASVGRCIFYFKEVKKMKKHSALFAVMPALALASCGTLPAALDDGILTVGLECGYAPFN